MNGNKKNKKINSCMALWARSRQELLKSWIEKIIRGTEHLSTSFSECHVDAGCLNTTSQLAIRSSFVFIINVVISSYSDTEWHKSLHQHPVDNFQNALSDIKGFQQNKTNKQTKQTNKQETQKQQQKTNRQKNKRKERKTMRHCAFLCTDSR